MRRVLVSLLLLAAAIAPAAAQTLWGSAKYGMTEAQVLKLYPGARPITRNLEKEYTGLYVAGYRVARHPFDLRFIFKDGQLTRVRLDRDEYVDNTEVRAIVADLSREFTHRYGPEVRHEDRPLRGLSLEIAWRHEGAEIEIDAVPVTESSSMFFVVMKPARGP
jgi:hypothetical protein